MEAAGSGKGEFTCSVCGSKFPHHGRDTRGAVSGEEFVETPAPFLLRMEGSSHTPLLCLGGQCVLCASHVCASPACSLFLLRWRFCADCCRRRKRWLPKEVHGEVDRMGEG